jgi:hypothetical protein
MMLIGADTILGSTQRMMIEFDATSTSVRVSTDESGFR